MNDLNEYRLEKDCVQAVLALRSQDTYSKLSFSKYIFIIVPNGILLNQSRGINI